MNLKTYFDFDGKATRSEYWGVNIISYLILILVAVVSIGIITLGFSGAVIGGFMILSSSIALGWIVLATTARRCRDAGINPWFSATILIPYFAVIPWIVFGCLQTEKTNGQLD